MIKEAISLLVAGKSLSQEQAAQVMDEIMTGAVTPAQFGAFVTALRLKGETVEEIAGMASVMRAKAVPVTTEETVVDTCGTGGDNSASFNISTAAAFVAAGAGVKIAKHGNRAMSSRCGSADVLEAMGVRISLSAEQVQQCIREVGIGFMLATAFHPSMKYAAAPRKEIGIRTVFNVLGPMTNPASARAQVVGVADGALTEKLARVLQTLGSKHALVVHGEDGLDEITVAGRTGVCEVKDGKVRTYSISPEEFGMSRAGSTSLKGGDAAENAALLRGILEGSKGARRDAVLLNSAAAVMVGGKAKTLKEGIEIARDSIDSGRALAKLTGLAQFTQSFPKEQ